ncbi:sugar transferase [Ammoniphilus sp. CFH 90114]|uniref:sugar transferase n=1 Tax=Ammoniphilus sp. CFH 90114 TaxID=2493665 RepID=UPI00272B9F0D|nr:sugar transferase [Ammoniphilus sp. CFH 90114]
MKKRLFTMGNFIKKMIDFSISFLVLTFLSPFLVLIAIAIKIDSNGPVFFKQERVGKKGKLFYIYKFRSMVMGAEKIQIGNVKGENDTRITKVGMFIRRYSLDELPQLINILKGDMSIVGPRPTLKYQVEQYNDFQMRRLEVKPGITGWAQVNGRNNLTWSEKIKLDNWYIDNWSIFLDIKVLYKTMFVLFRKNEVYYGSKIQEFKKIDTLKP